MESFLYCLCSSVFFSGIFNLLFSNLSVTRPLRFSGVSVAFQWRFSVASLAFSGISVAFHKPSTSVPALVSFRMKDTFRLVFSYCLLNIFINSFGTFRPSLAPYSTDQRKIPGSTFCIQRTVKPCKSCCREYQSTVENIDQD